jgi:hypothetical protein
MPIPTTMRSPPLSPVALAGAFFLLFKITVIFLSDLKWQNNATRIELVYSYIVLPLRVILKSDRCMRVVGYSETQHARSQFLEAVLKYTTRIFEIICFCRASS